MRAMGGRTCKRATASQGWLCKKRNTFKVSGGIGSAVTLAMSQAGCNAVAVHCYGIPKEFLDHASRGQVLEQIGLTPDAIATSLGAALTRLAEHRP